MRSDGDPVRFRPLPSIPQVDDPVLNSQLLTARQQSQQFRSQLQQISARLASRRETLNLTQLIVNDIKPLYEAGGISRNQYLRQANQVQEVRAQVASIAQERTRVIGNVAAQLNQIDRQMIRIKAELVGLKETISYRTVKAPIDGKVFDIRVSPQTVVGGGQSVLKLVPANRLQANVEVPDGDIGFVKVGMPVSVSVDSFPSGEFGYIKGTLSKLGSDALPPDQRSPRYRFPATISLQEQIVESGDNELNLQSGLGVTANIKLRSRPVISLVNVCTLGSWMGKRSLVNLI